MYMQQVSQSHPQPTSTPPQPAAPAAKRQAKRVKPKLGKNILVCSLYGLLILIVLFILLLIGIAKTGIVHIPIASRLCEGTKPTRTVEAGVTDPEVFINSIGQEVAAAIRRGERSPYAVALTESELTAAVRGGIEGALREEHVVAECPQIVVTPEYLEASGMFMTDNITLDILIQFTPRVENHELTFDVQKAYLADVPIAPDLVTALESYLFERGFGSWRIDVGTIQLNDVHLKEGEMEVILVDTQGTP